MSGPARLLRCVLFVFGWLVVGGEETEVRHLARHLDPDRYRIEVVACLRRDGMPEQTHRQLEALGVPLDTTPYRLDFDATVAYLAEKLAGYDLVVACQAEPSVYPALERMARRPPLIEHGGTVREASAGPKHLTTRYVGVCRSIRDAAAAAMPDRPHHALEIPSMVDLAEFDPADRVDVRAEWGVRDDTPVVGWIGRLDRKKRVEDFLVAAALVHQRRPDARFVVVGGPDFFMPEYEGELRLLAKRLDLEEALCFLGDRDDVPRLLAGLDALAWLARGEGMPHVVAEAGAARLAVVATPDNGVTEQLTDGVSGLFVPYEDPPAVAARLEQLLGDPDLRRRLGAALRRTVEDRYSATILAQTWARLFDEVLEQGSG